jgi:hypothetical protein
VKLAQSINLLNIQCDLFQEEQSPPRIVSILHQKKEKMVKIEENPLSKII